MPGMGGIGGVGGVGGGWPRPGGDMGGLLGFFPPGWGGGIGIAFGDGMAIPPFPQHGLADAAGIAGLAAVPEPIGGAAGGETGMPGIAAIPLAGELADAQAPIDVVGAAGGRTT